MNKTSMRLHLTISFAIVALIPILVLGGLQVFQIKKMTSDYNKTQMQTTYRLADAVQTYAYYHKNAIETLATTISASSPPFRTRESLTLKLQSVRSNLPGFSGLFIVNRTGSISAVYPVSDASAPKSLFGIDVSGRDYFTKVKASDVAGITPLFRGPETADKPAIIIAAPVYNDLKQWDGLVVGVLDLQALGQLVTKYDYGEDAYPVVVDTAGRAIYYPSSNIVDSMTDLAQEAVVQDAWKMGQGQGKYSPAVANQVEFITYKNIKDLGWTVWVARSYRAVNAAFTDSLWTTFLLLIVTLFLTVIVGTLLAKRLNHTIHVLVAYTQQLANGDFRENGNAIASRRGPYELSMLADHFFQMAEQIKVNQQALMELNSELESRVAERTRSLQRKNQELAIMNKLLTPIMPDRMANDFLGGSIIQLQDLIGHELRLRLYPHSGITSFSGLPHREQIIAADEKGLGAGFSGDIIPMTSGSLGIGELVVQSHSEAPLSEGDRELLRTFSNTAAIILHNEMLHSSIRHEHATWNAVLESMSEAIVLIDMNHKVVYANKRMTELFRFSQQELVSMTEQDLFHSIEAKLQEREGDWTAFTKNQRLHAKLRLAGDAKKEQFILVSAFQVRGEERNFGKGYIWRDITKEHEIDALKSDLISLASHEFKTPITSLRGGVETLLRPDTEWDEDFKQELLEGMREDIGRIQDLIDEWLDISKIEAGALKVNLQPVRVQSVVQSAKNRLPRHTEVDNAEFEIVLDRELPLLLADKSRLEQVLVNLFVNAIRYNLNRPRIRVSAEEDGRYVRIRVQDNGVGIAEEDVDKIFDRFYRVDVSSSRQTGGTGLGLAISKGIVEAHGGRLDVDSTPGVGSTFVFSIPIFRTEDGNGYEEI